MSRTPEQLKQDQADYASAYHEMGTDGKPVAGQDDVDPAAAGASTDAPADTADAGEPAGQTPTEAAGDTAASADDASRDGGEGGTDLEVGKVDDESAPGASGDGDVTADAPHGEQPAGGDAPMDVAKETQRLKSWEGRLKALEAQLKGPKNDEGETPAVEAIEEVADQANVAGKADLSQAADKAADAVEQGTMTPEQAMKQLAEDFGDDFVNMITVVAKHIASQAGTDAASKHVGPVKGAVDEIIGHLNDSAAKAHFREIQSAHPDFHDIGKTPEFKAFVEATPGAAETVKSGSSEAVNKLLATFKAQGKGPDAAETAEADTHGEPTPKADEKPDPAVSAQMDAAEGVRSSGLKLPDQPKASASSYEDAWKELG